MDEHNLEMLKILIPACEAIYQLNISGTYDGYRHNIEKAKELFVSKFPDKSEEDFLEFVGNCFGYYYMITGHEYFTGKTSLWKDLFKNK
jgi:hypothetical protein